MKCLNIVLTLCVLFAGCSSGPQQSNAAAGNGTPRVDSAAVNQTPSATPAPAAANGAVDESADDNADFAGTAGITEKKNAGITGVAMMNAARTARHGNYDRVVFEFEGAEMPSYHIEYVDKPVRSCGSGEVVPLAGNGWLEIRFNPANAHGENGYPTVTDRERSPNLPIIKEMKITCDFEADVEWVLGVSSPNKYRVLELKNPTRLVVDIKHK
jgi:hypothetical protein